MRWIGLVIIIVAVVLAALPVAADQHDTADAQVHQEWLKNADQCQRIVDDMEAKGMKTDWFLQKCLRKDRG
ncbi:hypothetical protein O9X99_02060 [Agrobacterium salinitolerans]|uniref:Entry exclusion lipoprotein TrbK n=1 Tax=Agrobacterium salinitolerans TaxID=1183413 RepID=A0ABY3BV67_9HYPH|nr:MULTISPECIES: hypothetical protein [Agrobacterium]MCZ7890452.1 hypothetical protein [Agrobacterium salinitolerans]TRA96826.1 hypothetical protein EXN23_00895 [Agrobacterium salinitolerans]